MAYLCAFRAWGISMDSECSMYSLKAAFALQRGAHFNSPKQRFKNECSLTYPANAAPAPGSLRDNPDKEAQDLATKLGWESQNLPYSV